MDEVLFIMGGLAVLLLFGCVGSPSEKPQPVLPGDQPGGNLGDKDMSAYEAEDDSDLLPDEELIPPLEDETELPDEELTPPSEEETEDSELQIEVSDIFVEEGEDFDFISEEDIIEPL